MKSKSYFNLLAFVFFILSCENIRAQSPNWLWAKSIGGSDTDAVTKIAIDPRSGDIYITGVFKGTVDFDPSLAKFNLTSMGSYDIFISRFDYLGNLLWSKAIGGKGDDKSLSIAVDTWESIDIYITGSFNETVDFDPGPGKMNLTSGGSSDIFISKLDRSGNLIWVKTIGGEDRDGGNNITLDSGHRAVYVIGRFNRSVDFDPGIGTYNLTSVGRDDNFICKLDTDGNFLWVKTIIGQKGPGLANYLSTAIDPKGNGEICITGTYSGTVDFNPGPDTFNLTAMGSDDIFISKLDSSGNFLWTKAMNGGGLSIGWAIAVDPSGNGDIYVTGQFQDTVDFDPGPDTFNLTSIKRTDIFILRLDRNGNLVWVKAMGGFHAEAGLSIELDPLGSGDICIAGVFYETSDFDPGPATFNLTSKGNWDFFISRLDNSGNFKWAKSMGGIGSDRGISMALDNSGNAYVAGYFASPSISFDSINLKNTNVSGNSSDIYIAKLDNLVTATYIGNIKHSVSIYPNPASDHLTIDFTNCNQKANVSITDISGKIIFNEEAEQKIVVNIKEWLEGIYIVLIQTANFIETKKIVVVK